MKKITYTILAILLTGLFSCENAGTILDDSEDDIFEGSGSELTDTDTLTYPDFYPEYTWDSVQVCHHHYANEGYSEDDAKFLSSFPIICIEKQHGSDSTAQDYGDLGTFYAAKQLKKYNPNIKVLGYFSFNTDYGPLSSTGGLLYDLNEINPGGNPYYDVTQKTYVEENDNAHPEWAVKDEKGGYYYTSTNYRVIDHTYSGARDFLLNKMKYWVSQEGIDGVFIDGYGSSSKGENTPEREAGVIAMRNAIQNEISNHKITLGNCISASGATEESNIEEIFEKLESVSGGMMEHFCIRGGAPKENIAACIELMDRVGKRGKMIIVKAWPRYNFTLKLGHLTTEDLQQAAREDIVFPLACFLCGAGKYAYFCYSWAYTYSSGFNIDYDEYHKRLGAPLGDYKRDGYIFTREFEHASVWVDVENKEANIFWDE